SDHIFHRRVTRDELVAAIASDRNAALVAHALAAFDDETLAFFAEHGGVVSRLSEKLAAPAFGAFSASLHIHDNRLVSLPDEATPLWEAAIGEKMTRPERFIELLFESNEGRIAYLFDTIGQLDPARRAFALGLWMPNAAQRTERFRLLATSGVNAFREWHLRSMPFGRASYDLGMLLARADADASGAPASEWRRGFWTRAITGHDASGADEDQPIDALWLVETIGATDVRQRGERQDQFSFAQRLGHFVATDTDRDRADLQLAIRSFPRFRMLMVTLERIGVRAPAVYGAAARHAAALGAFEGRRGFLLQAQLQGSLALVARAVDVRAIDSATAESLVAKLVVAPPSDEGRYGGAIAAWMRESFLRAVPRAPDADGAIIAALAGGPSGDSTRAAMVTWEGQQYRLDLGAAERQRLREVREKQDAISVDLTLAVAGAARQLASDPSSAATVATQLGDLVQRLPRRVRDRDSDAFAPGVPNTFSDDDQLKRAIDEIAKASRSKDTKRIARVADAVA
ncbi:MAG TPA: hypothetical protein VFF43_22655, partial [Caldimonas sp.]|nr:hypothetical protein [Caldimonas sp.]